MKKILSLICVFISMYAHAQKDIAVTILSPINNTKIIQGKPLNLKFRFKNTGLEAIPNTDTIVIIFPLNNDPLLVAFENGMRLTSIAIPLPNGLAIGGDTVFSLNNVVFPNIVSEAIRPFCISVLLWSDNLFVNENDMTNNYRCRDFDFNFPATDMEVSLHSPISNQAIILGVPFDMQVNFKNVGDLIIPNTDIIELVFSLDGNALEIKDTSGSTLQKLRIAIPNGLDVGKDTTIIIPNIVFENINSEENSSLCVVAIIRNDGSVVDEEDLLNNTSCSSLRFRLPINQSDRVLEINLTSPAVGTTITNGVPQPFTYYAKNVSGQTLDSGTTFAINFGTRTAQGAFTPFSNQLISSVLTSPLADGDSVERTINFTLNMPAGTNNQSFICIAIYTLSGTSARFQVASCRQYNLFNNLAEIQAAAKMVKVYPNPAKSFINFEYEYNKASMITIYDITGKKVMQTNHDGINTQVDIGTLKNGLYLFELRTSNNEVIKNGKFNVN